MKNRIILSWSGGKDSCLALDVLIQQGYEIVSLVTTKPEDGNRTFAHDERTELIQLQGEALNLPVHFIDCTFETYTEQFVSTIQTLKNQFQITGIAFGDLYLEGHREWGEKVAAAAGVEALYPLWTTKDAALKSLENFVQSGYQAVVVRIREDVLDESWLGRLVDESFLQDVQHAPICPMGESGEYHTFVFDGPLFAKSIHLEHGEIIKLDTSKRLEVKTPG
ncbi:diphthine--ammonia ligase [Neobacillus niacini]|uniref:Dph6-related ATP pyrophosphatase n=1 Tax=Neobacillus niacini TaxID=86668 RepID=UPI0021CAFD44|nr:diphthine--ammonia ligase [Neobacillus niacini]MCM3766919.1 diphthine--ammonia ligase [Neobacillus niacini]